MYGLHSTIDILKITLKLTLRNLSVFVPSLRPGFWASAHSWGAAQRLQAALAQAPAYAEIHSGPACSSSPDPALFLDHRKPLHQVLVHVEVWERRAGADGVELRITSWPGRQNPQGGTSCCGPCPGPWVSFFSSLFFLDQNASDFSRFLTQNLQPSLLTLPWARVFMLRWSIQCFPR